LAFTRDIENASPGSLDSLANLERDCNATIEMGDILNIGVGSLLDECRRIRTMSGPKSKTEFVCSAKTPPLLCCDKDLIAVIDAKRIKVEYSYIFWFH
jgi:hypothetical protein